MATSSPPPATTALAVGTLGVSVLCMFFNSAFKTLAMAPGNTLIGSMSLWTLWTGSLIDTSMPKLLLSLPLLYWLGSVTEAPAGRQPSHRIIRTVLLSLFGTGVIVSIAHFFAFMMTGGKESFLYAHQYGTLPLVGIMAVLAAQVHGDAPLSFSSSLSSSSLPTAGTGVSGGSSSSSNTLSIAFSHLPFLVTLFSLLCSPLMWNISTDEVTTPVACVAAWVYLRFFARHSDGSIGDARDDFEFFMMLPGPLRVAFRPLEKIGSALCYSCVRRASVAVSGGSSSSNSSSGGEGVLPSSVKDAGAGVFSSVFSGTSSTSANSQQKNNSRIDVHVHVHGGGGLAGAAATSSGGTVDPIAERRREKALRALDKRLAEIKGKMRTTVPGSSGSV